MKKDTFIAMLRLRMAARKDSQLSVWRKTGVPQTVISRCLRGGDIGTRYTLALLEYLENGEGETTDVRE